MADLSDVSNALGIIIGAALYPSGALGEQASPVAGLPVRVEVGWPSPQSLQDAIAAGKAHVSIYPGKMDRNTSRHLGVDDWQELSRDEATYTLTLADQTVTVAGSAPSPYRAQNIAITLNGADYAIQATAGQTASQVAAALLEAIATDFPGASAVGAVLTLPDIVRVASPRVGTTGLLRRELGRQERQFQISVWAPTPAARDAVAQPTDLALRRTERFDLPDSYSAGMKYAGSMLNDFDQKAGIFRRDLFYTVDYATTESTTATEIVVFTPEF